jgi:hypothetical protein
MALPWARLDVNIGSHDKVLQLISDPSPKRWQALASYVVSIGWCVGHGTDGRIPKAALPFVHGTETTARLLVKHDLWLEQTAAWAVKNFAEYQITDANAAAVRDVQKVGGSKGACRRWHTAGCECWKKSS